jgi:Ca2+-binding RTX toxin-like protein
MGPFAASATERDDKDLRGTDIDDAFVGGNGDDTLSGGDGDDWVDGNDGDDVVGGGFGDDVVIGGAGPDMLNGRADDDLIGAGAFPGAPLSNAQLDALCDSGDMADVIAGLGSGNLQFSDDGDADTLFGEGGSDATPTTTDGTADADTVQGGTGDDLINGLGGDDDIFCGFVDGADAALSLDGVVVARLVGGAGLVDIVPIRITQGIATDLFDPNA